MPIVPGTDPNAPPEGDVWNNDGTPTMPPVTVEDQYDPPRWSPPPLYREPFDAYPPPSWGGIPSPGAPGSDGPSDNPVPTPSPAPAAPASPFVPQPDDQPVAPPAYGVVTFDSEGEPLQRDNRDPQRPGTLIPEHLQAIHQQVVRELLAAQAREDSPITVLIAAFICLPGYLVGIIWYGLKYKAHSFDAEKIKQGLLFIPLVAMTMAWVPTILVPNTGIGLRLQIAGFSLVLTLLFGYIWIAIVRLSIAVFSRIELIKE